MNQVKFVCLTIAMLCAIPCFGKKVPLNGHWREQKKSIVIDLPIDASIEESSNSLQIYFYDNLGIVDVTITDVEGNVVYDKSLLTSEISNLAIPLSGLCDSGVLSITDGINDVYGNF